jgi:hypothetical protein
LIYTILFFIGFISIRLNINDYFIFDTESKSILIHRHFFFFTSENQIASFNDILCITPTAKVAYNLVGRRWDWWWEYYLVLILKSGKIVKISNSKKLENFDKLNEQTKFITEYIKCFSLESTLEKQVYVKGNFIENVKDLQYRGTIALHIRYWIRSLFYLIVGIAILLSIMTYLIKQNII